MPSDQGIPLKFRARSADRHNGRSSRKKSREWNCRMVLPAIQCVSAIFQFIAAWQSVVFLSTGRLGRVWSFVSLALFLKGFLSVWELFSSTLVHDHVVRRPDGRDRRILHLPAPRLGLPPHRSMVPLQGAPRGAVRPDRRGGAFPGGRPRGGEDSLPGVRHPLPHSRVPPRLGGNRRSRRNDPRGVQRGGRLGVSPGGHAPLGRHGRRAGAARKRRADGRHDHREGGRRRAPLRVAGRLPASRARSLRRGPDRAARLSSTRFSSCTPTRPPP